MRVRAGGGAQDGIIGRKHELLGGVCFAALVMGSAIPAAHAATFYAANETELYEAIADAQSSPDAASTIEMTASFEITTPPPAIAGKAITIATGTNTLTLASGNNFDIASGASLTLSGQIAGTGVLNTGPLNKTGEGTLIVDATGSGLTRIGLRAGHTVFNGGGELSFGTNGASLAQLGIAVEAGQTASMTISGEGTRLVGTGTSPTDMVGSSGTEATLTIEDGGALSTTGFRVHTQTGGGLAHVNVLGEGSILEAGGFGSFNGTTNINVRDGGVVDITGNTMWGGFGATGYTDAQVTAVVSGEGSRWDTSGTLGMYKGKLSVLDGGVVTAATMNIATNTTGDNTYFDVIVSGEGSELNANAINLATRRDATLTVADGGNVSVNDGTGTLVVGNVAGTSIGQIFIGGGNGRPAEAAGTIEATEITLGSSSVLAFNHTETDYEFEPEVSGQGMIYTLSGRTIFNTDQADFTGRTNVFGGMLEVNGILGGDIHVAGSDARNPSILAGIGTVGETTNREGGAIAPGSEAIGTLTIDGNYIGQGGVVQIEAVLGDDSSATDLLQINGNSTGNSFVTVTNLGGAGAQTTNGIKIIDIDGEDSSGTFSLLGDYVYDGEQAVVGGAYAYRLYQGGVEEDGNWYLRSDFDEGLLFQAGVPVYEAYAGVLQSYNQLGTLQQRLGNRSWTVVAQGADAISEEAATTRGVGIWGEIEGGYGEFDPQSSTTGTSYDVRLWRMKAGMDTVLAETAGGELIGGVALHYGTVSSDISSVFGSGSIDATGYGATGTLTWYGNGGFYVDGQAQVTAYDSDLSSDLAGRLVEGNDGIGYALGVELGQRIPVSPEWALTPQAQLAWSSVEFDDFDDAFGARVSLDSGDSLIGRLGLAVDRQSEWLAADGTTSRAHVYGIGNLYYDFQDGTGVTVADTAVDSEVDALWGGLGIGGTYSWADDRYGLYGEALAKTQLEDFGDSHVLNAKAGFRLIW